jgi:hypothetical protein
VAFSTRLIRTPEYCSISQRRNRLADGPRASAGACTGLPASAEGLTHDGLQAPPVRPRHAPSATTISKPAGQRAAQPWSAERVISQVSSAGRAAPEPGQAAGVSRHRQHEERHPPGQPQIGGCRSQLSRLMARLSGRLSSVMGPSIRGIFPLFAPFKEELNIRRWAR